MCKSKTLPSRYLLNGILWHLKFFQSFTERFTNECHYISKPERQEEPDKDEAFKSCGVTSFLWRREERSSVSFCRSDPSAVCTSFQTRCAVECVQRDQALSCFYQQLKASASCSFLF